MPVSDGIPDVGPEGPPPRKRARQACLACNARRVKCNVTEQRPCQNCILANCACETRESRRGKHPRPSKRRHDSEGGSSHYADEVAASHVLASLHKTPPHHGAAPRGRSNTTAEPEDQATVQEDPPPDDSVFLGESSSLRYVHDYPSATSHPFPRHSVTLRHSVPNDVKADVLMPEWEIERRKSRINFLRSEGAFSLPDRPVVEELLTAYFRWFHPCFAVVDEVEIWDQYHSSTLSFLLLQAMLFLGVIHCEESTLQQLGLGSRHKAKYIFYNRAKDIYDAEVEQKKLTVIQALFLMSFWRAGALLEKDSRHWLGASITLAETKALHRSAGTGLTRTGKLRKRIWWSMYTRERQCAAALGLPNRVRDEDCDVEPLDRSDYEYAFGPTVPRHTAESYTTYAIGMADLAQLLGKVVVGGYLPHRSLSDSQRAHLRDELQKWKQRLPPEMQADKADFPEYSGFYSNMLHLAYNNLLILLYRPGYISPDTDSHSPDSGVALSAAARNSRIIEDMLSEGSLRHGQIHVITNLFNTLCIHTVALRRSEGTTKTVAEHRAKLCLLGLQELQRTWEVTNWVLQLFFQYLDLSTAARLLVEKNEDALDSAARTSHESAPSAENVASIGNLPPTQIMAVAAGDRTAANALVATAGTAPASWTTEEANQFLFSQIENEFAFGEGGMYWSPDENAFNGSIFQPELDPGGFLAQGITNEGGM